MRRAIDLTTSILILVTITGLVTAGSTEKPPAMTSADSESVVRDLVVIDVSERPRLRETGLPVIWKGAAFFLAEWDADQRDLAREIGIPFETLAPDLEPGHALHLFELPDGTLPPEAWRGRILLERGRRIVVAMDSAEAATWTGQGYSTVRLDRRPREWAPLTPRLAYDCSYDPLVQGLLDQTSETRWVDWIEKLSGVEPVTVAGETEAIATRFSATMFQGASWARGYDFALQQCQSWGYASGYLEEHAYTGTSSDTWKNLVLTIPGQSFPDQIVMLTAHLDNTSPTSATVAPGANDNGTGNAMLFEAARLLRQMRFERTIKIVWFTGEEQGLYGSEAYVADYPTTNIAGVVNLDMFGWDGDGDRCFEIHAGTLTESTDVGTCFRNSIGSYGLGLSHDFLTTGATDRSDHASFWQVDVGAIEIAENFFNDGLPDGCVGQDANPGYHTLDDTVADNMMPSFGFDIARAAMATIASMAAPIESCFDDKPDLAATAGVSAVDLAWTAVAGASSYRVYRSVAGCEGQWHLLGETAGISWLDDTSDQPLTYHYQVEAVEADGFCVSAASDCMAATPTIYHASHIGAAWMDVCASGGPGTGDGILDPGESALVPVMVENDGNAALTDVSGTLTTATPGFEVIDPDGHWPDLSPSAAAESLPNHFGIQIATDVPCGTTMSGDLALGYAQGANPTSLTARTGLAQEIVLLNEDFAGGIPADWTVVDGGLGGGAASTWTDANPGARSIAAPFNPPFAIVDSDEAGTSATQDEQLITPSFDATACQELVVEFSNQFNWYSGGLDEQCDVDVSIDGGNSWTNVFRMNGADDGHSVPNTKSIDLMPFTASDPDDVILRFHYYDADYEFWWAVDNVIVRCAFPVCTPCDQASVPPGEPGVTSPVRLGKEGPDLVFEWGAPEPGCGALDHMLYRGDLGTLRTGSYAHDTSLSCSTGGTSFTLPLDDSRLGVADYFLVVSTNGVHEGPYGRDSRGVQRPSSSAACHEAQNLADCEGTSP